jgi:type IV pilus assembly protein PilX
MSQRKHQPLAHERGYVMITSLLLLLVVTIMAVSMYRSFGVQEQIAGNLREKGRALQAAESAQQFAEQWLSTGSNSQNVVTCNGSATALTVAATQQRVCSNALTAATGGLATSAPWIDSSSKYYGVLYTPPGMSVGTAQQNPYYAAPGFYIYQMGASADGSGNVYKVDAYGYGGSPSSVAVVESTYIVGTSVKDLGGQ